MSCLIYNLWCNCIILNLINIVNIGYNSGSGNDNRINRGNQPGSYNGMFQSDDQQLFIGKIPPDVMESDLRVCLIFYIV